LLTLRARLAKRKNAATPSDDAKLRDLLNRIATRENADRLRALRDLALAVDQPADPLDSDLWIDLVNGNRAIGRNARAADLAQSAAIAIENKSPSQAAELKLTAAAILIETGDYPRALEILKTVLSTNPSAPQPTAERAWLLKIHALSANAKNNQDDQLYIVALRTFLSLHPLSSRASEIRSNLAQALHNAANSDEARALWLEIPTSAPQWLDARLAVAAIDRDALRNAILDDLPPPRIQARLNLALAQVSDAAKRAPASDRPWFRIAEWQLDLLHHPQTSAAAVLENLHQLIALPLQAPLRAEAERIEIEALIAAERFPEAERAADRWIKSANPHSLDALVRDLGLAAHRASSDRIHHGIGPILLASTQKLAAIAQPGSAAARNAQFESIRALALSGDSTRAKIQLEQLLQSTSLDAFDSLRAAQLSLDLGMTDQSLNRFRELARNSPPASQAWFQARLGMAQSLAAKAQTAEAKKLVEATALLYPDLGGEPLRSRFKRLAK
jgi:hypothetical protein